MNTGMRVGLALAWAGMVVAGTAAEWVESEASPPKGVALTIYDSGLGLVRERRTLRLAKGDNLVRIRDLPARMIPLSVSFGPEAETRNLQWLEQQFSWDAAGLESLLQRYLGRQVFITTPQGSYKGDLQAYPGARGVRADAYALLAENGVLLAFPASPSLVSVGFPNAPETARLEPVLAWRLRATDQAMPTLTLNYSVDGLAWEAAYVMILDAAGQSAALTARAALHNESGGDFDAVRVRLVAAAGGGAAEAGAPPAGMFPATGGGVDPARFFYGRKDPAPVRAARPLLPAYTHEAPEPVSLADGETLQLVLFAAPRVPVSQFYVYDGVVFDRFQRNRRDDWNYGTESQPLVERYLEFANETASGLGFDLPPGRLRLFRQADDETLDALGEDMLDPLGAQLTAALRLGPARGLRGERERTGFSEVVPLHEYEETFEIRLWNDAVEDAQVRVVEHLYRWPNFEVVKADTEYTFRDEQTIEFRPELKSGGVRTIHYTVRYKW